MTTTTSAPKSSIITELALNMVGQRNLTVHTYYEKLAKAMYEQLEEFAALMTVWLSRIKTNLSSID